MTINKPYHRNFRTFASGPSNDAYISHPAYAQSPEQYVRAFLLIQKDLQNLFDYIEPSNQNLDCYSFRIHELLMRTCVEVEANCKAILLENTCNKNARDLTIKDYKKIDKTHKLSSYKVKLPYWHGEPKKEHISIPFSNWAGTKKTSLEWYQAYNKTKHDRHKEFPEAKFRHLIDAVCGLVVILTSQFFKEDFSKENYLTCNDGDHWITPIGKYFRVKPGLDWPAAEKYNFDWKSLENEENPFQKFDYSTV